MEPGPLSCVTQYALTRKSGIMQQNIVSGRLRLVKHGINPYHSKDHRDNRQQS
jgi:hypothetical protein